MTPANKRILVTTILLVGVSFIFLRHGDRFLQIMVTFALSAVMEKEEAVLSTKSKNLVLWWIIWLVLFWSGIMRRFFGWFNW